MPILAAPHGDINYEDTGGTGPVVLAGHCFLLDQTMFDAQKAAFPQYRWVTWDARDHGKSRTNANATAYSYWDQARDGLRLLDHLNIEHATYFGHSQGGYITLRMRLLAPHRCDGLLMSGLSSKSYTPERRENFASVFEMWQSSFEGRLATTRIMAPMVVGGRASDHAPWITKWMDRGEDWEAFNRAMDCFLYTDDITEMLHTAADRPPALVLRGETDQLFEIAVIEDFAALLGAELHRFPEAGHGLTFTHADASNAVIGEWLATVSPDARVTI